MAKKENNSKLSIWVWLLATGSLAGLVVFLFILSKLEPPSQGVETKADPAPTEKTATSDKYGFYERLKDTVVPITVSNKTDKQSKPKDDAIFLLQVASFRSHKDADRVRAKLILLGLTPRIEEAESDSSATWYRVIVGPFASRSKLQGARSVLLSNRFEALLIKRKPEKG